MVEMVGLRTERLLLRAWRDSDRGPYAALNADPKVMEFFPAALNRGQSDDSVDRLIAHHGERGFTGWAVQVLQSSRGPAEFIGFVGLLVPTFDPPFPHAADPVVEIGWRLSADWWGLGLATEAAVAAVGYGLNVLRLPEIVSFTVPTNVRSRAVMERIGMTYDTDFDHPSATSGDWWQRHVLYRIGPASAGSTPGALSTTDAG